MTRHLLIIDDEESLIEFLSLLFVEQGFNVETASSVASARRQLDGSRYDLVLCDIMMPDGNGLDLLSQIKKETPRTAVIMMTAYTSTKSAIEAMRLGAYDYISKPFDVDELKLLVERALEKAELEDENIYLRRELEDRYAFSNIIGKSPKMQAVFGLVDRVARTTSTVLVQGESGTGKELIAHAIHFASPRAQARFLSVNCGALPENLLESELFGHERGAFTGAVKEKHGLFQDANNGTLFLDEISETTPAMQVKLLRALQEKKVRKVGGTREQEVDVRIIAATNRDLEKMVADGTMREDLYYRINVIPIQLPPLRQRREDIPLLVEHFLDKYAEALDLPGRSVSVDAMSILEAYEWPGNVRELENTIERTLALSAGDTITSRDLPVHLATRRGGPGGSIELPSEGLDLEAFLDEIRAQLMAQALERTGGVQTQAAELVGMSFRSFRYYAKKAGLTQRSEDGDD